MRSELFAYDRFYKQNFGTVIGVDEAGRGCLAGPVVAAAVILEVQLDVFDSKQLTAQKREELFLQIMNSAEVGIGIATPEEIDLYNIFNATKIAMNRALASLNKKDAYVLVDGKSLNLSQQGVCIVKGDEKSASIAAASIVAKVLRDRIMVAHDRIYPCYGFSKHKGYGTVHHLNAIRKFGPTVFHRLSFSPVLSNLSVKKVHDLFSENINCERAKVILRKLSSS